MITSACRPVVGEREDAGEVVKRTVKEDDVSKSVVLEVAKIIVLKEETVKVVLVLPIDDDSIDSDDVTGNEVDNKMESTVDETIAPAVDDDGTTIPS